MTAPRNLFLLVVIIGGSIWLQVTLSRMESRWPGLALPGICFLLSFLVSINIFAYQYRYEAEVTVLDESGRVIEAQQDPAPGTLEAVNLTSVAMTFLLFNIPTALYGSIYAGCRGRRARRLAVDKMSLQDLE